MWINNVLINCNSQFPCKMTADDASTVVRRVLMCGQCSESIELPEGFDHVVLPSPRGELETLLLRCDVPHIDVRASPTDQRAGMRTFILESAIGYVCDKAQNLGTSFDSTIQRAAADPVFCAFLAGFMALNLESKRPILHGWNEAWILVKDLPTAAVTGITFTERRKAASIKAPDYNGSPPKAIKSDAYKPFRKRW